MKGVETMPRHGMKVYQIDCISGDIIGEYKSLCDAEKATHVSKSQISKCCNKKYPQAGGYIWCLDATLSEVADTIKKDKRRSAKVSLPQALEALKKYQNILSYQQLSKKTGYSCEELHFLYEKYKIYRYEG